MLVYAYLGWVYPCHIASLTRGHRNLDANRHGGVGCPGWEATSFTLWNVQCVVLNISWCLLMGLKPFAWNQGSGLLSKEINHAFWGQGENCCYVILASSVKIVTHIYCACPNHPFGLHILRLINEMSQRVSKSYRDPSGKAYRVSLCTLGAGFKAECQKAASWPQWNSAFSVIWDNGSNLLAKKKKEKRIHWFYLHCRMCAIHSITFFNLLVIFYTTFKAFGATRRLHISSNLVGLALPLVPYHNSL